MEASVLLGHSINLQKARELAYNRDLEGSTKEILRLAKQSNFAHGMDTFQMEAFAKATGRSVEDLLSMVQASEEMNKALRSSDPTIRSMAAEYQKLKNANEAAAKASGKSVEHQLMLKSNQERLTAISQKWEQIVARVSQWFLPVIDAALSFVDALLPAIPIFIGMMTFSDKIGKAFSFIGLHVKAFALSFAPVAKMFAFLGKGFAWIGRLAQVGGLIAKWAPMVFRFVSPFLKFLGPLGLIITGFQFITDLFKRWIAIANDPNINIGQKILQGIVAVGRSLVEVLVMPFKTAWDWIVNKLGFGANSPSKLGLSIVAGIVGVRDMLFDAITYPFRHAFAWILDKIPGAAQFADKLRGGLSGLNTSVEANVIAQKVEPSTITSRQTVPAGVSPLVQLAADKNTDTINLSAVIDELKLLREEVKKKSMDVYLDGSLISSLMARNIEFRGGYGVNR